MNYRGYGIFSYITIEPLSDGSLIIRQVPWDDEDSDGETLATVKFTSDSSSDDYEATFRLKLEKPFTLMGYKFSALTLSQTDGEVLIAEASGPDGKTLKYVFSNWPSRNEYAG